MRNCASIRSRFRQFQVSTETVTMQAAEILDSIDDQQAARAEEMLQQELDQAQRGQVL